MFSKFSCGDFEDLIMGKSFTTPIRVYGSALGWTLVNSMELVRNENGSKDDLDTSLEAVKTLFGITLHYVYAGNGGIITNDVALAVTVLCGLVASKAKGIKYSESLDCYFDVFEDLSDC